MAEIEAEQRRVGAAERARRFEAKVQAAVGRVWGEEGEAKPSTSVV